MSALFSLPNYAFFRAESPKVRYRSIYGYVSKLKLLELVKS